MDLAEHDVYLQEELQTSFTTFILSAMQCLLMVCERWMIHTWGFAQVRHKSDPSALDEVLLQNDDTGPVRGCEASDRLEKGPR
jgi:hypothetical protein